MRILATVVVGDRELPDLVDDEVFGDAFEIGQRHILADVLGENQAIGLPVLGGVSDSVGDGLLDRAHVDLLAVQSHPAGDVLAIAAAEQAHGELRPPCAHQSGDADDLAAPDVQVDVLDHLHVLWIG